MKQGSRHKPHFHKVGIFPASNNTSANSRMCESSAARTVIKERMSCGPRIEYCTMRLSDLDRSVEGTIVGLTESNGYDRLFFLVRLSAVPLYKQPTKGGLEGALLVYALK